MITDLFYNMLPWVQMISGIGVVISILVLGREILNLPRYSSSISEDKLKEMREDNARNQVNAERLEQEVQTLTAQLEQAKTQNRAAQAGAQDATAREKEVQRLIAQMEQTRRESKAWQAKAEGALLKEDEIQKLTSQLEEAEKEIKAWRVEAESALLKEGEIQNLTSRLEQAQKDSKAWEAKAAEAALKENEVKKLTARLGNVKEYEERIAFIDKAAPEIDRIHGALDEEKKALHEMKLHMQELRMRLQLLNEKTKDAVESIAQFAQGKEFDEFRKSIHMDEIVQKYEEQIRALKLEHLEKKPER